MNFFQHQAKPLARSAIVSDSRPVESYRDDAFLSSSNRNRERFVHQRFVQDRSKCRLCLGRRRSRSGLHHKGLNATSVDHLADLSSLEHLRDNFLALLGVRLVEVSGRNLFWGFVNFSIRRMSKEDLIQICGLADGIRMFNILHIK